MDEIVNMFKPHEERNPSRNKHFPNYRPGFRIFMNRKSRQWTGFVEFYTPGRNSMGQISSSFCESIQELERDLITKCSTYLAELS